MLALSSNACGWLCIPKAKCLPWAVLARQDLLGWIFSLVWGKCFHAVDPYRRAQRRVENMEEAEVEGAGKTGMLQVAVMVISMLRAKWFWEGTHADLTAVQARRTMTASL